MTTSISDKVPTVASITKTVDSEVGTLDTMNNTMKMDRNLLEDAEVEAVQGLFEDYTGFKIPGLLKDISKLKLIAKNDGDDNTKRELSILKRRIINAYNKFCETINPLKDPVKFADADTSSEDSSGSTEDDEHANTSSEDSSIPTSNDTPNQADLTLETRPSTPEGLIYQSIFNLFSTVAGVIDNPMSTLQNLNPFKNGPKRLIKAEESPNISTVNAISDTSIAHHSNNQNASGTSSTSSMEDFLDTSTILNSITENDSQFFFNEPKGDKTETTSNGFSFGTTTTQQPTITATASNANTGPNIFNWKRPPSTDNATNREETKPNTFPNTFSFTTRPAVTPTITSTTPTGNGTEKTQKRPEKTNVLTDAKTTRNNFSFVTQPAVTTTTSSGTSYAGTEPLNLRTQPTATMNYAGISKEQPAVTTTTSSGTSYAGTEPLNLRTQPTATMNYAGISKEQPARSLDMEKQILEQRGQAELNKFTNNLNRGNSLPIGNKFSKRDGGLNFINEGRLENIIDYRIQDQLNRYKQDQFTVKPYNSASSSDDTSSGFEIITNELEPGDSSTDSSSEYEIVSGGEDFSGDEIINNPTFQAQPVITASTTKVIEHSFTVKGIAPQKLYAFGDAPDMKNFTMPIPLEKTGDRTYTVKFEVPANYSGEFSYLISRSVYPTPRDMENRAHYRSSAVNMDTEISFS